MKEYYVNGTKNIIYEKKTYECRYCSKDYTESEKASPHDARKFCNKKCYDKYQKGKPKGIGHFGPFILKNEKKKRIKKSDVEVDLLREKFALIASFTLNTTKNKVIKNKLRLLDLKLDGLRPGNKERHKRYKERLRKLLISENEKNLGNKTKKKK